MKKSLSILLALVMILSLTACGDKTKPTDESTTTVAGEVTTAPSSEEEVVTELDGETGQYTYRTIWTAGPLNWNPHAWEMSNDDSFMDYITTPFVYASVSDNEAGWEWKYSAATAVTDITESFGDKEKFGVPADATEGHVLQIDLNPEMKWENGDKITADDYIYSMKSLLDPTMKNYRANDIYSRTFRLAKAEEYFNNDKAGNKIYKDFVDESKPADAVALFAFDEPAYFFNGKTAKSYYDNEDHKEKFIVDGVDLFEKYKDQEAVEVTDEVKAELTALATAFEYTEPEAWKEFCVYDTGGIVPETKWEEVGLLKTGDYQLIYISEQKEDMFYMLTALTSNWLVHEKTYEDNKKQVEGLVATSYGTDMDSTASYGPYKIKAYEKDKQIILERNENWGGYTDGMHEGQYQADNVIIDIIDNHATALQRFGQGLSDGILLNSDDLESYKKSDRLYYVDLTYTARYIFATSLEALNERDKEKGGGRRAVLHYKDFRKALSLSIDRQKYCEEATSGFKPATFLYNTLYYWNMAKDPASIYRHSSYAKKGILDLYNMEYTDENVDSEYAKITGRDVDTARELFQSAYEKAVADGNYTDGEDIPIEIMATATDLQPQHIKQQDLMQAFFDEASTGTPFEGKIKVKFEGGDSKRYDNVALGKNMAIHGAWGGAAFYPFSNIRVYTNPTYMGGLEKIHESNGWNPSEELLTLTINKADGTSVTEERTFEAWSNTINGSGEYVDEPSERLQVLSGLERGVLEAYQCIPLGTYTDAYLLSYKLEYQTQDYNIMYGYGGFRNYKFNYDDAEWSEYVKENKGKLNYE